MIQGSIKPAPGDGAATPVQAARPAPTLAARFAAMIGWGHRSPAAPPARAEPAIAAPSPADAAADPQAAVATAQQVIAQLSTGAAATPTGDAPGEEAQPALSNAETKAVADLVEPGMQPEPAPDMPLAAEPEPAPSAAKAPEEKVADVDAAPKTEQVVVNAATIISAPLPLPVQTDSAPPEAVAVDSIAATRTTRRPSAERKARAETKAQPIIATGPGSAKRAAEPTLPASWASAFTVESRDGKALSVAAPAAGEIAVGRRLDLAKDGQWLDALARDIVQAARSDSNVRFELTPETLGALTVEIAHSADGAAIRITTASEHSHRAIEQARPQLVADARAQGVRVTETRIDLDQRGGSGAGEGWARQDHAGGRGQGGGERSPRQSHQPVVNLTHSLPDAGTSGDEDLYA